MMLAVFCWGLAAVLSLQGALIDRWQASDLEVLSDGGLVGTWTSSGGARVANADPGREPTLWHGVTPAGGSVVRFADHRLYAAASPVGGLEAFSVAIVFRAESPGANLGTQWYSKSGIVDAEQAGYTADWGTVIDEAGHIGFGVGDPDQTTYQADGSSLVDGSFHVAVFTWGGGTQTVYVDDRTPVSQTGSATLPRNNAGFSFGSLHTDLDGQRFSGDLVEVQFYDSALTGEEAAALIGQLTAIHIEAALPFVHAFSAAPNPIYVGSSATLSWNVANATGLSIDPGVGSVPGPTGAATVSPAATTTYTLIATNADGSAEATVTVTVDPGIPVAFGFTTNTVENTSVAITLSGQDPNGDPLTYHLDSPPQHGVLSGIPPRITYTPATGYLGDDQFTFHVNDGRADSSPAVVRVTVVEPPVAPADIFLSAASVPSGTGPGQYVATMRTVDVNLHDRHTYQLVPGAANNALFAVASNQLWTASAFAATNGGFLTVRIRVTDSAALSLEKDFLLHILSARRDPVINEIHYNPAENTVPAEFVEFYNPNPEPLDMGNWRLRGGVDFNFPPGTQIGARDYLVVAQNPSAIFSVFGVAALGPWTGSLDNDGEQITLRDAGDRVVDQVDYRSEFPWPIAANGGGVSMELINPALDNDLGSSWSVARSDAVTPTNLSTVFIPSADPAWHYRRGTNEASTPASAWRELDFAEDATWSVGRTSIGYADGDDNTVLSDMQNSYVCFFARHAFTVAENAVPETLVLRVYVDDGVILWINGQEVARPHVSGGDKAYDVGTGTTDHEAAWETIVLANASAYLRPGQNVLAAQVINVTLGSSDLSFDLELKTPDVVVAGPQPTPGRRNGSFLYNAAPNIRQVNHTPQSPRSTNDIMITAKVTDPEGVGSVSLACQLVAPGAFIPSVLPRSLTEMNNDPEGAPPSNPAFEMGWVSVPMVDDGTGGDAVAGDDIFTGVIPASPNRTLVRYRVTATDLFGATRRAPFADDPSLNFAAFVYDGVPAYEGIAAADLESLPVYFFITRAQDLTTCTAYTGNQMVQGSPAWFVFNWQCAVVCDGEVYDHVCYRLRGANGRYQPGKRSFRFKFNDGRHLAARDPSGARYPTKWSSLDTGKGQSNQQTLTFGLNEAVNYFLWNKVGVPAPFSHFFHWRVIDSVAEAPDRYGGDFWGLCWAQENYDVRFLEAHGLPKGNLYKLINSTTVGLDQLRYQAPDAVTDGSDHDNIQNNLNSSQTAAWLLAHVNYPLWYRYHAICEGVRNYDFWPGCDKNAAYYFEPAYTSQNQYYGRLWILPWDVTDTWGPTWNSGQDSAYVSIFSGSTKPELIRDYRNTVREIRDLLFQRDQIEPIVDAFAGTLARFVPADLLRWSNAPAATGNYRSMVRPGPALTAGLAGYVQDLKNFMFAGGSHDWWTDRPTVSASGWVARLDVVAADAAAPQRPVLTYNGPVGYPVDHLTFSSSAFTDPQGTNTFAAMQWRVAQVLPAGTVVTNPAQLRLEWDATWDSGAITDGSSNITLPPTSVVPGQTYRVRVRHQDNTGRWSGWSAPIQFAPTAVDLVSDLRASLVFSEIMYHPPPLGLIDSDELEFIELRNAGSRTLDLGGLFFSSGVTFSFPLGTALEPGDCFLLARNPEALAQRYPGVGVQGVYTGKLNNAGETLAISHPHAGVILAVSYGPLAPWPVTADGFGFSLVLADPVTSTYAASAQPLGTPGTAGAASAIGGVVVNEVLTSTTPPLVDAIELRNLAAYPVDVTGWYLTDDPADPRKYRIPTTPALAPGEFLVVDEGQFNPTPGAHPSFSLSSFGDQVYLFSADAPGNLTGYSHGFAFDGARDGVSYGRHVNSVGEEQLTPQIERTLGAENAGPALSPVVLSEIHFHPPMPEDEFVELRNLTAEPVPLHDPTHPTNTWNVSGLSFTFPTNISIAPRGFLVLVSSNANGFRARFSIPDTVPILEYAGGLQNNGERLAVRVPDLPSADGVPYYPMDRVRYSTNAPWPINAAGGGDSLQRLDLAAYADDPINWQAAPPTPGTPYPSGQPLMDFGIQLNDDDGDPELRLFAEGNRTFTIQFADSLENPVWYRLIDIPAQPSNRLEIHRDPAQRTTRFYRAVTPAVP